MATSGDIGCGVCEVEHITKDAEHWCPECEQGLCSHCLRYHNALKSSRNHGIISIDSYKQLPPSIINIKQYCTDHDRKFTNYCPQHESLCCPFCIPANHKDCHGILALEEIIKSSKTSTLMNSMEQSLKDIKINMDKIIENKKQNLATIKTQTQKFQDEIKQTRDKINKQLDNLEQQIRQDLSAMEEKVKLQIENLLEKLFEIKKQVEMLHSNILTVKQYASDLQTFLGSKTIEAEIQKHEKAMQSLLRDGSVHEISLKCNIEDNISQVLATVSSFGIISIELDHSSVVIKTEKDKQAQLVSYVPAQPKAIHDISLIVQRKIDLKEIDHYTTHVTGCTITSTGYIVLTDNFNSRLLILKEDGSFYNKISLSISCHANVTCIDDRTVAVSFQSSANIYIQIYDIYDKKKVRIIETTNYCTGVTYRNGFLLYAEHGRGIYRVQLQNGNQSLLIPRNTLECWDFLSLSNDKIYHGIHTENKVCCYTMSGEKIWEYNDESTLKNPIGVTIDKSGNIYVVSYGNNSIIVISCDGKSARCMLGIKDGIKNPYGICIDREKNILLTTLLGGTAILYKLT